MASRAPVFALLIPVAAISAWQLLVATGVIDYAYLPAPSEIAAALVDLLRSGDLVADAVDTLAVALLAAAVTVIIGGVLGLVFGLAPRLNASVMASIDVLRTIPAVALVPVAVLSFGATPTAELVLAVYAAMWPVLLTTATGAAAVHPRQYDVARMLHLPPTTTVCKIVVPAAVPAWLVGARLAAITALLVTIMAELIMSTRGLGGGLVESLNALAPARMWAYALVCGVLGYVLNAALRHGARVALPGLPALRPGAAVSIAVDPTRPQAAPLRGLLPLAGLLTAWQLLGRDDSLAFPPPEQWLHALARLRAEGALWPAIGHTVLTFGVALALATLLGAAVGIAIGASRRVDRTLTPTIDFLAAVPGAVYIPLAVLLLGTSPVSGVTVVALVASWPILLHAAAAMRAVPTVRVDMSRTLGLSTVERWRKVVLPTLAPTIMLGVRIAASLALILTLLVDILGAGKGIGRLLLESQQRLDAAAVWGLLLVVGTLGYLSSAALAHAETRLRPSPAIHPDVPPVRPAAPKTGERRRSRVAPIRPRTTAKPAGPR